MARPTEGFDLQLYLAVSNHSVSAALIQESPVLKLIYFVSRTLQGAEERYSQVEKVALALITAARRLRPYFQSHQVVIRTNHPIAKILQKPDLAGRMVAWSIELSEFGLRFEPHGSIKGQHLADFTAELSPAIIPPTWTLSMDGSLDRKGGGAGVVLEGPNGELVEQAISFNFQLSNNQAEYEALISGLLLAVELEIERLECRMDSQLVVGFNIAHVPRAQNSRADLFSKLTHSRNKSQLTSVIRTTLDKPLLETCSIDLTSSKTDWRHEIIQLMTQQEQGGFVSAFDSKRIARYTFIGDDLYRRGYTTPLLKCLSADEGKYVIQELHHGICGTHSGKRLLQAKILRAGFYWPTIERDYADFVRRCISCQSHGHDTRIPPSELMGIISPWPFAQWGMDIAGPLPIGSGQRKYLLVAVDYFTKWIEAEALATITARKTNGQAEAANKVIIAELKRRLGQAKGLWVEELPEVLWATVAHRTALPAKLLSTSHMERTLCYRSKLESPPCGGIYKI
ncbi:uncharacterized protein LOC106760320 [Vigna radiata var. radiata]|uniref:Uncharacterized protein LOC106760320 n=1 Tax=Vigna radiata var. radiata TaxID=3916 RepID=A0A1S3TZQ7_VIGRR|nr:uncharacterized protein LOC106760320 [Vigna radiata var. radiata]